MLPVVEIPPWASFAILHPRSYAPGATPLKPLTPYSVAGGDARDMGAVGEGVEEEIEGGALPAGPSTMLTATVSGGRARAVPAERLVAGEIIVHRPLIGERAVAVGIGEQHPSVAGADDDHRHESPHAVSVHVRGRCLTEAALLQDTAERLAAGAERDDPAEAGRPGRRPHGIPTGASGSGAPPFAGEITQIENLPLAGRGRVEPAHAGSIPLSRMAMSTPRPSKVGCAVRTRRRPCRPRTRRSA